MVAIAEREIHPKPMSWRKGDHALDQSFERFRSRLRRGSEPPIPLVIPDRYVPTLRVITQEWGKDRPEDKERKQFNLNGRTVEADFLYRDSKDEFIAAVVVEGAANRNDELVFTDSSVHAREVLKRVYEEGTGRMVEVKQKPKEIVIYPADNRTTNERVIEPNGKVNGHIGTGIKALRTFTVVESE